MGRRIVMADGTIYEGAEIGYAGGVIWCYLKNTTIIDAFADFSDADKTEHLVFQYGEMQDEYTGYTVLTAMVQSENDAQIELRKGA